MRRTDLVRLSLLAVALIVGGCSQPPDHQDAWLSFKYSFDCGGTVSCGMTDEAPANRYYQAIGIADPTSYTFGTWLAANGFPAGAPAVHPDAHAIYANLGDIRIGRDMNCTTSGQNIACYVINYSRKENTKDGGTFILTPPLGSGGDLDAALGNAISAADGTFLGAVAMVYNPNAGNNQVTFYVFNSDFELSPTLNLDDEGAKSVPRMCMSCHGGTYNTATNTATGSSFLPFDVYYFRYSKTPGFTFDDQQESLRKLNALVVSTNPNPPIADLINGIYPGGVATPQSAPMDGYVPPGWSANPNLYTGVVRQYCRTCHVAQAGLDFTQYTDFQGLATSINHLVCDEHDMPHGEVAYGGLHDTSILGIPELSIGNSLYKVGFWWDDAAQSDLGNFLNSQHVGTCLSHN